MSRSIITCLFPSVQADAKLTGMRSAAAYIKIHGGVQPQRQLIPDALNAEHVGAITRKTSFRVHPDVGIGVIRRPEEWAILTLIQRPRTESPGFRPCIRGVHRPVPGHPLCESENHTMILLPVITPLPAHACGCATFDVIAKIAEEIAFHQRGIFYKVQQGVLIAGKWIRKRMRRPISRR